MSADLLPCPFCGGEAQEGSLDSYDWMWFACEHCGVKTEGASHRSRDKAVEQWNRRPEPSQVQREGLASLLMHADHLAKCAEMLLTDIAVASQARQKFDDFDGGDQVAEELQQAEQALGEGMKAVRSAAHEYKKRRAALSAYPTQQHAGGQPVAPFAEGGPGHAQYKLIEDWVADYEFENDDGHYSPNEAERMVMLDSIHGLLADDEFIALQRAIYAAPAADPADAQKAGKPVAQAIIDFLHGAAPLEGVWFGEKHPTRRGSFWWRRLLPPFLCDTAQTASVPPPTHPECDLPFGVQADPEDQRS